MLEDVMTFPINHPYPDFGSINPLSQSTMLLVTFGSKAVKTKENTTIYVVTAENKQTFWSHESLRGGLIVDVTERKAGTEYTAQDGSKKTVLKDGLNFNFVLGTATDAKEIALAKVAKLEIEL